MSIMNILSTLRPEMFAALQGGEGNIPPPPTNVPRPGAPNVAPPYLREPLPELQRPDVPAPAMGPQMPAPSGFMGGEKRNLLDRVFGVISQIGMPLYQAGEQRKQENLARLRSGLRIGQPPQVQPMGLGFNSLPPTGLFGG